VDEYGFFNKFAMLVLFSCGFSAFFCGFFSVKNFLGVEKDEKRGRKVYVIVIVYLKENFFYLYL